MSRPQLGEMGIETLEELTKPGGAGRHESLD